MGCRDDNGLLPRGELIESEFFDCAACSAEYDLILEIVEKSGDDSYYDRAMAAFQLAELFDSYDWKAETVEARALDELIVIRAEQVRFELQKIRNSSVAQHSTVGGGEVE